MIASHETEVGSHRHAARSAVACTILGWPLVRASITSTVDSHPEMTLKQR
jgi:hypothetical protein